MRAQSIVSGNHTRKTASFVRACGAYNFITIPSIFDVVSRLRLYLLCGQVLISNLALTQADSFFKAAVSCISEVPLHMGTAHNVHFLQFLSRRSLCPN